MGIAWRLWQFGLVGSLMLGLGLVAGVLAVFLPLVVANVVWELIAGGGDWPLDRWLLPSAIVWVPLGVGFVLRHLPPVPAELTKRR